MLVRNAVRRLPEEHNNMEGKTDWLNQMTYLFLTTKQNIDQHIRNVFAEGELAPESAASPEHGAHHPGRE